MTPHEHNVRSRTLLSLLVAVLGIRSVVVRCTRGESQADREGTTLVLKDGEELEVLATNKLDDVVNASPAVAGKQLFLRGEKFLYCIEGK